MKLDKNYRPSSYKNIIHFEKEVLQFIDNMSRIQEVAENEYELFRITTYSGGYPDIISLRGIYENNIIRYRIVDNFKSKNLELNISNLPTESSSEPLSYGEIINIIDNTNYEDDEDGLYLSICKFLFESGESIDEIKSFVNIESIYYPLLKEHYKKKISILLSF